MTWTRRDFIKTAASSAALAGAPLPFAHAEDYPSRLITMVVPYAAGGGLDILARQLQKPLETRLGQPIVIENRPGAGTVIGANSVAHATPDGYTIMLATSSALAINATLHKTLPYDPITAFAPIVLVANAPFVLLVTPSLPVKSILDLIALAKEKPGALSYASAGPGSPQHLFMELLKTMTGIDLVHVPYRGDAPALTDLMAGHIPIQFCEVGTALPHIRAGKVRVLGVSSATRMPNVPDIPPIADAMPGFDAVSWQMIVAPAGTPETAIDRLHKDVQVVLALPEVQEEFGRTGRISVDSPPPAELARYIQSEITRWGKVVEAAGIKGSQ
ncbi:MAG: Bug family tripartite tricarboxylate transporter substrate binding protein [Xanthobacteraceae bacterium]